MSTIWEMPDDLWEKVVRILEERDPVKPTGRPRVDRRAVMNAIVFRLRSGCQWNRLPERYPDDSTVHRTFQRWVRLGVFDGLWAILVKECEELGGVDWEWQSIDGGMGKARLGGDLTGPNPTDRGKNGTKRSVMTEGDGGPIAVALDGANRNDHLLLEATIEALVVERPEPTEEKPQHLCLDAGYDNATGHGVVKQYGYEGHIRSKGDKTRGLEEGQPAHEEGPPSTGDPEPAAGAGRKRYPARRWVVERTLAWLNRCRSLLVRYEKWAWNYLGLIQLACGLLWYRRLRRLTA